MKRFLTLLCALLLCCNTAQAAFDFTPWQLEGDMGSFFPMLQCGNEVLTIIKGEHDAARLRWWQNGQLLRAAEDAGTLGRVSCFCPVDDGSAVAVLRQRTDDAAGRMTYQLALRRWNSEGLGEAVTLPGVFVDMKHLRNGLVGLRKTADGYVLALYDLLSDADAQEIPLNGEYGVLNRAARDAQGWWVSLGNTSGGLVVRVTGEGVRTTAIKHLGMGLCPDGQGGAFAWGQPLSGDGGSPITITWLNGDLTVRRTRSLTGKKLQVYLDWVQPDGKDGYVLYGSAVSASRKVYRVFRMTCDGALKKTALDVREFAYDGDYGYHVGVAPDGSAMVLGNMISYPDEAPMVAVPFDALPKAKDPGLTLK